MVSLCPFLVSARGGRTTPMTYEAGGRQFVVIAAGGRNEFGYGDTIIAYALP
jgi:quinoprotein glucose dehydrogenase